MGTIEDALHSCCLRGLLCVDLFFYSVYSSALPILLQEADIIIPVLDYYERIHQFLFLWGTSERRMLTRDRLHEKKNCGMDGKHSHYDCCNYPTNFLMS